MDVKRYMHSPHLTSEEKLLLLDYERLYIEYKKKNCVKCIKRGIQKKRECALLRGFSKHSCETMGKWINRKQKEKRKATFESWFADIQETNVRINELYY